MFSSLKLNSLKCQTNGGSDNKKDGCEDEDDDDVSDHMYEKLPNALDNNKPCKCHLNHVKKSPKSSKTPFSKRISKWRMECPGITNHRNSCPDDDRESKNNQEEKTREMLHLERSGMVRTKITTVNIQREDGNLGITLRGGFHQNADLSRPVIITYVKPDGPAAKEGTIKPGDRLLAVDGVSLQGSSLSEAQTLLKQPSATTLLTIEYDVSVLDSVEHANGPLLVEIERTSTQQLGLTLFHSSDGIIIERVKPGSLADRCGALHVGDEILAVNATRIDGASIALEDVMKILECECPIVRLEILPSYAASCYSNYGTWRTREHALSLESFGVGTLKGTINRKHRECKKEIMENGIDYKANHVNPHGFHGTEIALTHCETLHTTLSRENGSFGIQFIDAPDGSILINSVTPGGPAERSQCLHPGDRILSVNHRSIALDNLTAKDLNDLLDFKSDEISCSKLSLHTEFDVLDTVVPASGIFVVKLAKRGSTGLGITMTGSKSSGFVICEMKKGSIAHRAGSLIPGDKLLAINNVPLDQCSVEYAAHILHQSTNIVTLKVQREESNPDCRTNRKITYTVDLQRYGGPLGITIAGSEEPFQPITISGLTAGGLAEQTGVIHVGDEILAINNHSLYGEPLSKAHSLLQSSSDLVTLKISRSIVPICRIPNNRSPILPSSIDSAVESWDSSHLDLASTVDHQKPLRDSKDCTKRNLNLPQQWEPLDTSFLDTMTENPDVSSLINGTANSDLAMLDEITSQNFKIKHELDLLSMKLDEQRKSKLLADGNTNNNLTSENDKIPSNEENEIQCLEEVSQNVTTNGLKQDPESNETDGKVIYSEVKSLNVSPKEMDHEYGGRESFMTTDFENFEMAYMPETRNWCKNQYFGNGSTQGSIRSEFQSSQLYEVTLYKDPIYEDFGFSVSDGLYERGVFVNRIRKGGPADLSNVLKPYDRILQVNDTYTQDFDCCLTVPLIASAGDSLVLLVARNATNCSSENESFRNETFHNTGLTLSPNKMGPNNNVNREELRRILV